MRLLRLFTQSSQTTYAGKLLDNTLTVAMHAYISGVNVSANFGLPESYPNWNASIGTRPAACPTAYCYNSTSGDRYWGTVVGLFDLDVILHASLAGL